MNAQTPGGLRATERPADIHLSMDYENSAEFVEQSAQGKSASGEAGQRGKKQKTGAAAVPPQLAAIEVRLSVEVGGLRLSLRELMDVEPGQLFPLDRMTAEPVNVLVNGKPFARGEIVAVGERFGVRLIDIEGDVA